MNFYDEYFTTEILEETVKISLKLRKKVVFYLVTMIIKLITWLLKSYKNLHLNQIMFLLPSQGEWSEKMLYCKAFF